MVPESHPLQQLFVELVGRHYAEEIGLRDPQLVAYVSHLLAEFCDAEQLFKLRNAAGRPLSDVGEMLLESDPIFGPAPSFDRERQVRKHIGDYTLFFAGMFRWSASARPVGGVAISCFFRLQLSLRRLE